jgi:hypothetical protein
MLQEGVRILRRRHGKNMGQVHLSLERSISPKRSLLPPLLAVPTEVADAADEKVEKDVEGLWWRFEADGLRCLRLMVSLVAYVG